MPSILAKCGPWREMALPEPAFVTDDTQMTLAFARGIRTAMDRGVLGPLRLERPVRDEFVRWYHSPDNNRAPGATCLTACRLLDSDRPWQRASRIDSKGCGANMRVAPIGLVPGLSDEQRGGAAQLQAALTHGHPTALAASDLTARAVYLLAHGGEPQGLVGQLRSYAYENREHYYHRWLGDLWSLSGDPTPETFIARGWDECLEALERLQEALRTPPRRPTPAWPPETAGSPRKPSPPACSASSSSPRTRSPPCAARPARGATPTPSPASRARSRAPTWARARGPRSGRSGSSTTAS